MNYDDNNTENMNENIGEMNETNNGINNGTNEEIDNRMNETNETNNETNNVLNQILCVLAKEDHLKIFTGDIHPNIYDAVSPIVNSNEPKEIERTLKHYFEQVIQITQNNNKINQEARRMLQVLEKIFKDGVIEIQQTRDLTDEIVDFYMVSLKHFAGCVNEAVLNEHIEYLDRQN